MTPIEFDFVVSHFGWAAVTLGPVESAASFEASYVSDALGQLLDAVVRICDKGSDAEEVTFYQEPAETRLYLTAITAGVQIVVRERKGPTDSWTDATSFKCAARELARAVLDGCERIGRTAYRENWALHEFPDRAVARLREIAE